jgi:hypothetical protein
VRIGAAELEDSTFLLLEDLLSLDFSTTLELDDELTAFLLLLEGLLALDDELVLVTELDEAASFLLLLLVFPDSKVTEPVEVPESAFLLLLLEDLLALDDPAFLELDDTAFTLLLDAVFLEDEDSFSLESLSAEDSISRFSHLRSVQTKIADSSVTHRESPSFLDWHTVKSSSVFTESRIS